MSEVAIRVENLSKQYRIGQRESYKALRDVIADTAAAPFRRFRSAFNGNGSSNGSALSTQHSAFEGGNSIWALDDVSFDVKRGEVAGIIGRNGAGKSTLLKILSRITKPTKGYATIHGRIGSLLEVGTGFHPELTGRENIYLNGAILGMRKAEIERKFDEIVAFAEVEKFIDTPVKRYSSGMYVRLAFAVAAHMETEVLVIDEVLAVGDAEFQKRCLGKINEVARGGRTVLFVSHNMHAVQTLCTRAIVLKDGKIAKAGSVDSCIDSYLSEARTSRSEWIRPTANGNSSMLIFEQVSVALSGEQPDLTLDVAMKLRSRGLHKSAFVAVDVLDARGVGLMQAMPATEGFLRPEVVDHDFRVLIDLPPLVPGRYSLKIWVGPHNTETFDQIEDVASFEVMASPSPGRTFEHSYDHGAIVPRSRVVGRSNEFHYDDSFSHVE
ncbi:MAG TPA: ABC transporter ATP-binding protein [Pyrinomonadaceae bacterium]|nr:ABC transporter ATP-binding protein [Pyrinomonadaceae bacterium]